MTFASVIARPSVGELYVAPGPPDQHEYTPVHVDVGYLSPLTGHVHGGAREVLKFHREPTGKSLGEDGSLDQETNGVPDEDDPRRLAAALGYLFTPVVPLLNMSNPDREDRWMRFHSVQALVWSGPFILLLIVTFLLFILLVRSNIFFICLLPIVFLVPFAPGWDMGARRIYLGDEVSIPIIGRTNRKASRTAGGVEQPSEQPVSLTILWARLILPVD